LTTRDIDPGRRKSPLAYNSPIQTNAQCHNDDAYFFPKQTQDSLIIKGSI